VKDLKIGISHFLKSLYKIGRDFCSNRVCGQLNDEINGEYHYANYGW
jgi:hypothetical protein